jgi:hypothetical protein
MEKPVTFKHLIAGSVFYYQAPKAHKDADPNPVKTLTFVGKKGGIGYYETSDPGEIEELTKLANNPQVQVERVEGSVDVALETPVESISKPVPEEVTQAVTEVQTQAARAEDPAVVAAQSNLARLLASQNS